MEKFGAKILAVIKVIIAILILISLVLFCYYRTIENKYDSNCRKVYKEIKNLENYTWKETPFVNIWKIKGYEADKERCFIWIENLDKERLKVEEELCFYDKYDAKISCDNMGYFWFSSGETRKINYHTPKEFSKIKFNITRVGK